MKTRVKLPISIPSKYLSRINIFGMRGRLLHLPAPKNKKKTFILLGGQHTAHERMYAIAQMLNDYGEVYMPDLPGFGGMDSFYKIGKKPTYDEYADYLYTFLKAKKLNNELWFFASSFGSQVMTRMFQKYPDSVQWTKQPISFVGFGAGANFNISFVYKSLLYFIAYPMSTKLGAALFKLIVFNPVSLRVMLFFFSRTKAKMQSDDDNLKKEMVQMEAYLWTSCDRRTHASSAITMMTDDLRKYSDELIDIKLHNIIAENDQYFDNVSVEKVFKELYRDYESSNINSHVHAPSLIAEKDHVKAMMSKEALELLAS